MAAARAMRLAVPSTKLSKVNAVLSRLRKVLAAVSSGNSMGSGPFSIDEGVD